MWPQNNPNPRCQKNNRRVWNYQFKIKWALYMGPKIIRKIIKEESTSGMTEITC